MTITVGTKVYYTGDMANPEGWFTVVMIRQPGCYDLCENGGDNREFLSIHAQQIGHEYFGHCNPRFVTEAAHRAYKGQQLASLVKFVRKGAREH